MGIIRIHQDVGFFGTPAILRIHTVPGEASVPPGNLLEMQILRFQPRFIESETPGV